MAYRARRNGDLVAMHLLQVLGTLRALYMLHQANHWQSSGPNYYGDHQLFERLYTPIPEEIDGVAERAVGLGAGAQVYAAQQSRVTDAILQRWAKSAPNGPAATVRAMVSLAAELDLLEQLDEALSVQGVSNGVQNLLQGIADKHESKTYLLQQQLGE